MLGLIEFGCGLFDDLVCFGCGCSGCGEFVFWLLVLCCLLLLVGGLSFEFGCFEGFCLLAFVVLLWWLGFVCGCFLFWFTVFGWSGGWVYLCRCGLCVCV